MTGSLFGVELRSEYLQVRRGPTFVHFACQFTGKERDSESGNDYFGARYYASAVGRFLSPDRSSKIAPVPYAKLDDPQSLNLYSYGRNNPLSNVDLDGHDWLSNYMAMFGAAMSSMQKDRDEKNQKDQQQAQQATHQPDGSYVAPVGPGSEIGSILDPAHPSEPGLITSPTDKEGQCVTACQHYSKVPSSSMWTAGEKVVIKVNGKWVNNPKVKPGTAIATFVNGRYPGTGDPHKNSGIYVGPGLTTNSAGMRIVDQWPGRPGPRARDMQFNSKLGPEDRSNAANDYYVIIVK